MAPESPLGPLTRLRKRLQKEAKGVGLELREFEALPHPDSESGPHHARAMFTLNEDFDPSPHEEDELDRMLAAQQEEERRQKEEESRKGLTELLENLEKGDGLL